MPIETVHPLYDANIAKWQKCRLAYEGEEAVKSAGELYLPKVDPGQDRREYDAYKSRALYYEAVGRTVDGFVGAISRKPHVIQLPEGLKEFETDATTDGTGLSEFIKRLCGETLLISRSGILVDYDEQLGRAYFTLYTAEAITNWSPASLVLTETIYEADTADALKQVAVNQIRQLHLVEGRYVVTIWRRASVTGAGQQWAIHSETTPTVRGASLGEIPFFWLSCMGRSTAISKPPLLGLVNVSMSHYRTSADLEHGRHFTAMPTLYVAGGSDDTPIRVGAGAAIL